MSRRREVIEGSWRARAFAHKRRSIEERFDDVRELLRRGLPHPIWSAPGAGPMANTRDVVTGVEVHRIAQRIVRGEPVEADGMLAEPAVQYERFLRERRVAVIAVGRPAISRTHCYSGTFDLLAHTPPLGVLLAAVLTGPTSTVSWPMALELAAYGNAEHYLGDDGVEVAMPRVDAYAALWLRPGGYDLQPIDVSRQEWRAFIAVARLARWLDQRGERVVGPMGGR